MSTHTENLARQDVHAFAMAAEITEEAALCESAQDELKEPVNASARIAIIRRTIMALYHAGLFDYEANDFDVKFRWTAEVLGVPYAELWLAFYHGCIKGQDIDRDELVEWRTWCEQHAPDRLVVREWKGG